jgi:hypothetical protein
MASEVEGTAGRPTSTSAFRTYLTTVSGLVERREAGATTDDDVWASWEQVKNMLVSRLADNVQAQLQHLAGVEQAERETAEGHTYVHRAHTPSVTQEPKCRCDDGDYCLTHRLGRERGDE